MVLILSFVGVLAFLVWTLLAPSAVSDVLQQNIPREFRTPEGNSSLFATIVIFFVGFGLFYEIDQRLPAKNLPHLDLFAFWSSVTGAVFLLVAGAFACVRPMQWMRLFNERLRKIQDDQIDQHSIQLIIFVAKVFGVAFLWGSFYIAHLIASSSRLTPGAG